MKVVLIAGVWVWPGISHTPDLRVSLCHRVSYLSCITMDVKRVFSSCHIFLFVSVMDRSGQSVLFREFGIFLYIFLVPKRVFRVLVTLKILA